MYNPDPSDPAIQSAFTTDWTRQRELFEMALLQPAEHRLAFVREQCADAPALMASLLALLRAHAAHSGDTAEQQAALLQQSQQLLDEQSGLAPSQPIASGMRLGAYQLLKELGQGGMGVVWLAERADGDAKQIVAIKLLPPHRWDHNARTRFEQERSLLATLEHPHIGRLYDIGSVAEQPYYVMEYIEGQPITEYVEKHNLTMRERLMLFQQVLEAVGFAHQKLVVHRDLKPSNILVDDRGQVKLIDFGIAKALLGNALDVANTSTAQRFFSPSHAAPEQLRGKNTGIAVDIYQLGLVLYELLSGKAAFDFQNLSAADIEQRIQHSMPVAPSKHRSLSSELDAIVLHALKKEANNRYASTAAMAEDLHAVLRHRPIAIHTHQRAYRVRKFLRRNWAKLLASAAFVTIIAASSVMQFQNAKNLALERNAALQAKTKAEAMGDFFRDALIGTDGYLGGEKASKLEGMLLTAFESLEAKREQLDYEVWREIALGLMRASDGRLAVAEIEAAATKLGSHLRPSDQETRNELAILIAIVQSETEARKTRLESLSKEATLTEPQRFEVESKILAYTEFENEKILEDRFAELIARSASLSEEKLLEAFFFKARALQRTVGVTSSGIQRALLECCSDATANRSFRILRAKLQLAQAQAYRREKLPQAAIDTAQQALSVIAQEFGDPDKETLFARNTLAQAYRSAGQFDESKIEFETSIAVAKLDASKQDAVAAISYNLAGMCAWEKRDPVCAEKAFAEALEFGQRAWGTESGNTSTFGFHWGRWKLSRGDRNGARPLLVAAIAVGPIDALQRDFLLANWTENVGQAPQSQWCGRFLSLSATAQESVEKGLIELGHRPNCPAN
jgi:eukaryotic-like serine/threonine-protein kinase